MKFRNKITPVFLHSISIAAMMFSCQAHASFGELFVDYIVIPRITENLDAVCAENNHLGKAVTDQCAQVAGDMIKEKMSGCGHYKLRIAEAAVCLPINYMSRKLSEVGRNNGYSVDAVVVKKCNDVVPEFSGKNLVVFGARCVAGAITQPQTIARIAVWGAMQSYVNSARFHERFHGIGSLFV